MSNSDVASKMDIREKIENTWALMKYFKAVFSESEYDVALEIKKKFLEEKLLIELNQQKDSNEFLAHHFASLMIKSERAIVNLRRVQLFLEEIENRFDELMQLEQKRAKGGRQQNDLMYDFAAIEIKNYLATHDGQYPSASYLSDKVSGKASEILREINNGNFLEVPKDFTARVTKELNKREKKLEEKGTPYLPIKTAEIYIKKMKLENNKQ